MAKKTRKEVLIERLRALLALNAPQKGIVGVKRLTKREKTKHFDMAVYFKKTTCGTSCCLSGFARLQPYFTKRGFGFLYADDDRFDAYTNISDDTFFGNGSHDEIFNGDFSNDWKAAMDRVRARIKKIKAMTDDEVEALL